MKITIKKLGIIVLLMLCIFSSTISLDRVFAYEGGKTLVVVDGPLRFRSSPRLVSDNILGELPIGARASYINTSAENNQWYYVEYDGKKGYIFSTYVKFEEKKEPSYKPNEDFEKYLVSQGFDDSYKAALRVLHSKFPNWIFKGGNTGLDFKYVVDRQDTYVANKKINVVPNYAKEEWKAAPIENEGQYDWGWQAASRKAIQHFLDPRNFLTERGVFQFISSKYDPSIHNKRGVESIIAGSFMDAPFPEDSFERYADLIMYASEQSGASPYALASMIILEQGRNGASKSISGDVEGYEGYYNFFNIGAYDGHDAVIKGLMNAKKQGWNSRTKSIVEGAKWYSRNYLQNNQHTPYLKKFNVLNGANNVGVHQYMTSVMGADSESRVNYDAYKNILSEPLEFLIPIYSNMSIEGSYQWKFENGVWHCYEDDVLVKSRWVLYKGDYYYLDANGTMLTGLHTISSIRYLFSSEGAMQKGFVEFGGKKYYANTSGALVVGWKKISNNWYYFNEKNEMVTGSYFIGGKKYYFNFEGILSTGWIKNSNGSWLFVDESGEVATGWKKIGSSWYYFDSNSYMVSGVQEIEGSKYIFNSSGAMAVGWSKDAQGSWYYAKASGVLVKGWLKEGGTWYYLGDDNKMAVGLREIEGSKYLFNSSGVMAVGWGKDAQGSWYYAKASGNLAKGWLKEGSTWYYLGDDNKMAVGLREIEGSQYLFNSSGAMAVGWSKDAQGSWYYAKASGNLAKGWLKEGSTWYYFGNDNKMVTGKMTIDGIEYKFNNDGAWIN